MVLVELLQDVLEVLTHNLHQIMGYIQRQEIITGAKDPVELVVKATKKTKFKIKYLTAVCSYISLIVTLQQQSLFEAGGYRPV